MSVHVDGARIANAVAALGGTVAALRSLTVDAGVDVLSFGGTKNGLLGGEAVVYLNPELATSAPVRAQAGHPAGVEDALRRRPVQRPARRRLVDRAGDARQRDGRPPPPPHRRHRCGVELGAPPRVNSLFPRLPPAAIEPLREWCFFWDWDVSSHQVRWMTAWDTTVDDVDVFAEGVAKILATCN